MKTQKDKCLSKIKSISKELEKNQFKLPDDITKFIDTSNNLVKIIQSLHESLQDEDELMHILNIVRYIINGQSKLLICMHDTIEKSTINVNELN